MSEFRKRPLTPPPTFVSDWIGPALTSDIEDRMWRGIRPTAPVLDGRTFGREFRGTQTPPRYAITRMRFRRGGWHSEAEGRAERVENFFPPQSEWSEGRHCLSALYGARVALPDTSTLLPDIDVGDTLGATVGRLRTDFARACPGFAYVDYEGTPRVVPPLDTFGWSSSTRWLPVLLWVTRYYQHANWRDRPSIRSSHNTEHTDDFGSDTSADYTAEQGGFAHDGTNFELDLDASAAEPLIRYSASTPTAPNDLEHESQATFLLTGLNYPGGGIARMAASTAQGYTGVSGNAAGDDNFYLQRWVGGTAATIATDAGTTPDSNDWMTVRIAAEGAAGANVAIDSWRADHGTTKPGDPGWISSTLFEYTDTAANRLDAAGDTGGGLGGMFSNYDARHDFFKTRAVSDRGGGGGAHRRHPGMLMGIIR